MGERNDPATKFHAVGSVAWFSRVAGKHQHPTLFILLNLGSMWQDLQHAASGGESWTPGRENGEGA